MRRRFRKYDKIQRNPNRVKKLFTSICSPCRAICEICTKEITTYVKTEFNLFAWLFLILVFYFYPFYVAIPILCVTLPLFRNVIHSCPYCFDVLSIRKFYTIEMEGKVKILNK